MPLLLLAVAIGGLLSTVAALRPPDRPAWLDGLAFLPSLVFAELAPQILVLHVLIVGVLTPWALDHTLSRIALVIAGVTTIGLAWLTARQIRAWRHRPGLDGPGLPLLARLTGLPLRPRDVEKARGVVFAQRGTKSLRVDVYRRKDHPAGAPVLVQVHGGAWVLGRRDDQGLPFMHLMARRGWVCISVEYRLSPRATFPDHIVDVKEGLTWARAHAAEYGGDPSRIVITGGSAGGHLCSLAALTPGTDQPGFEDADTSVVGCVSFYGVYDFTDRDAHWHGRGLDQLLSRRVMKVALADARDRYEAASPMSRITDQAPPFLLIQGTADTLVPPAEARSFARLLKATSRQPVTLLEVPHAQHAFDVLASLRTCAVLQHAVAFADEVTKPSEPTTTLTEQPAATPPEVRATS